LANRRGRSYHAAGGGYGGSLPPGAVAIEALPEEGTMKSFKLLPLALIAATL